MLKVLQKKNNVFMNKILYFRHTKSTQWMHFIFQKTAVLVLKLNPGCKV